MKYFGLRVDLKSFPQIKTFNNAIPPPEAINYYDWLELHHSVNTFFSMSCPQTGPYLDNLELNPRLKKGPSDVINGYMGFRKGFIVSDSFKNVLRDFELAPHVYFPCNVSQKAQTWSYSFLYFYGHLGNSIDFKNSPIIITASIIDLKPIDLIVFDSFNDYKEFFLKHHNRAGFVFQKIKFLPTLKPLDFFGNFVTQSFEFYISEALKNELINSKISNIETCEKSKGFITFGGDQASYWPATLAPQ